jgi:hypothetical protein
MAYGLMMVGHYFATMPLPADGGQYYYLSGAMLTSYTAFFIPKTRANFCILAICGATIFGNIIGSVFWHMDIYRAAYANIFSCIYIAACLFLTGKGAMNAVYDRILHQLRHLYCVGYTNLSRHLGGHK